MIKLTILIPSIPERHGKLVKLRTDLYNQRDALKIHPTLGEVEILFNDSESVNNGGISVGAKRDKLMRQAQGEYLCFIDDDELPSPNYLEALLRLCQLGADIVTFKSFYKCDGYWGVANMSLHHPTNEQATPYGEFKRRPFHICPMKSSIAKNCSFPDINNAEDWAYMEQVLAKCTTEVHTDQILHQYNHSSLTSAVDNIK